MHVLLCEGNSVKPGCWECSVHIAVAGLLCQWVPGISSMYYSQEVAPQHSQAWCPLQAHLSAPVEAGSDNNGHHHIIPWRDLSGSRRVCAA